MFQRINSECINELFGYFVLVLIVFEECGNIVDYLGVIFFFLNKLFINELWVIKDIDIDYGEFDGLYSVFWLSNDDVWMCGQDNIMWFYSFQGDLIKFI